MTSDSLQDTLLPRFGWFFTQSGMHRSPPPHHTCYTPNGSMLFPSPLLPLPPVLPSPILSLDFTSSSVHSAQTTHVLVTLSPFPIVIRLSSLFPILAQRHTLNSQVRTAWSGAENLSSTHTLTNTFFNIYKALVRRYLLPNM